MIDNQYKINENNFIIFLVGFMGSGKTSVGKALAETIRYKFLDSDEQIEKLHGMKISEIFAKYGEQKFRSLELEFIESTKVLNNVVIATGGGLPCYNDLMTKLLTCGKVIYIETSESIITTRLEKDQTRPLIKNLDNKKRALFISEKLSERKSYYQKAHVKIDGNKPITEIINQIQCLLT